MTQTPTFLPDTFLPYNPERRPVADAIAEHGSALIGYGIVALFAKTQTGTIESLPAFPREISESLAHLSVAYTGVFLGKALAAYRSMIYRMRDAVAWGMAANFMSEAGQQLVVRVTPNTDLYSLASALENAKDCGFAAVAIGAFVAKDELQRRKSLL